jgi:hypothetical protein
MFLGTYLRNLNLKLLTAVIFLIGIAGAALTPLAQAQASGASGESISAIQSSLCSVIGIVAAVIEVLAIFMFVLGGIFYAFAHFMPAAGNLKGSMQGWGMGLIMGSIIMLILYILAPFVVSKILSFSSSTLVPIISTVNCGSGGVVTPVTTPT